MPNDANLEMVREDSFLLQAQREAAWAWIKQGIEQRRRTRPLLNRSVLSKKGVVSRSSPRRSGFTLLEVMVAASILAFGALLISRSFFVNTDAAAEADQRLRAGVWTGEKMSESAREWERSGRSFVSPDQGTFRIEQRVFSWQRAARAGSTGIDRIDLSVTWNAGGRSRSLALSTFVIPS